MPGLRAVGVVLITTSFGTPKKFPLWFKGTRRTVESVALRTPGDNWQVAGNPLPWHRVSDQMIIAGAGLHPALQEGCKLKGHIGNNGDIVSERDDCICTMARGGQVRVWPFTTMYTFASPKVQSVA